MKDNSTKPESFGELDSPCEGNASTVKDVSLNRFQLKHLLLLTAAIGLYVQLSIQIPFVVPVVVPLFVFFIALRPYFGRYDIPIMTACFTPTLWAISANAIATPWVLAIHDYASPRSPYQERFHEYPVPVILFAIFVWGFVGGMIGAACSGLMSLLAIVIRSFASRGAP